MLSKEKLDELTGIIVDECVHIHQELGPGLLESVYEVVLAHRLALRGLKVQRQVMVGIVFDGIVLDKAFIADIVVENEVVVELKSVEQFARVHPKQLLTHIRLMNLRVGLLVNFGAALMKDGIKRIVNNY